MQPFRSRRLNAEQLSVIVAFVIEYDPSSQFGDSSENGLLPAHVTDFEPNQDGKDGYCHESAAEAEAKPTSDSWQGDHCRSKSFDRFATYDGVPAVRTLHAPPGPFAVVPPSKHWIVSQRPTTGHCRALERQSTDSGTVATMARHGRLFKGRRAPASLFGQGP
jgi:hypothetical protein